MVKDIRLICISCLIGTLVSSLTWAGGRPGDSSRSWYSEIGGGWLFPQGRSDDNLDSSFALSGGALYWPSNWPAGIDINLAYSSPDISNKAINAINDQISMDPGNSGKIDGGYVNIWALTVDGLWSLGEKTQGFYLSGGVGVYYLQGRLTETGLIYYPPICDPWYWWWCYPPGVGPGSIVTASDSTTKYGWNAGIGYSFRPTLSGQLYLEAKYHSISTDKKDITYVPIEVGYRFR